MILTIVPNPALDKTAVIPRFEPGHIFRVSTVLGLAGGKGLNFARALQTLGERALVVGPFGGSTGRAVLELAAAEGIACDHLPVQGETRTCLTIVDPEAQRITELYERGPELDAQVWEQLVTHAARHFPTVERMVVCGSGFPGAPTTGLRDLVEQANAAGVPALLDTYGLQLAHALAARPALVKINRHEAADLVGHPIQQVHEATAAVVELQARGAQAVVITLGAQGAAGIDRDGQPFGWAAPDAGGLYPTGSGDALLAGIVTGLARGQTLREAVRLGVAVGTANTLRIGAGVFDVAWVETLLRDVRELEV